VGKLEGRVAVATGAASGIGRGIAGAFAREGADVALAREVSGSGVLVNAIAPGPIQPPLLDSMGDLLARCYLAVRRSEEQAFCERDEDFEIRQHFYRF
jgi:NAD(P)-dependent dehydrogenase (short-subunit alcohol dehydrogenase family)